MTISATQAAAFHEKLRPHRIFCANCGKKHIDASAAIQCSYDHWKEAQTLAGRRTAVFVPTRFCRYCQEDINEKNRFHESTHERIPHERDYEAVMRSL